MRNLTPQELSLRIALAVGIIITILGSLIWISFQPFNLVFTLLLLVASTLVAYLIFYFSIRIFIDRKFRLIYKTIHNLKVDLKKEPSKMEMNKDIWSEIRKEVIAWDLQNRQEIERLTDQEKYRRDFLGNVSHELKTPLFSIQGYILSLLEGGLEDGTINRKFLLKAEKSVDRMIEMVNDLDEIAKLESNRMELNLQSFDLIELTQEVVDAVEFKAKKKSIQLKIRPYSSKSIAVDADEARIAQVLTNLIVNSINYGNKNGVTEIKFFDLDENILVEVTDNGRGIEEEHLPRLFERFYRVDKGRSRAEGGSGLGLAIVKHIIEAHKQTINVRSKIGEGSTFSFTLRKTS